jgi:repressor LexA
MAHYPLQLTRKQREVLTAIEAFAKENGYMPSVRELAEKLDLGVATVHFHLSTLQDKGVLDHDGSAHGLRFKKKVPAPAPAAGPSLYEDGGIRLPIVGTIAAGRPIEAIESRDQTLPVPAQWIKGESYILRVRGDSMKDDAILDGDLVVVQKCDSVNNGEIAVALLDDGAATLKRVFKEKGRIRLQPANEALQPIYVEKVKIQGKVTGVLRPYV